MTANLSVSETLKGAFADLGKHFGPLLLGAFGLSLGVALATSAVMVASVATLPVTALTGADLLLPIGLVILGMGVWAFFYTGFVGMVLDVRRGQRPAFGRLFAQGKRLMPAWVAIVAINGTLFLLPVLLGTGVLGLAPELALLWAPLAYGIHALTCLTIFYVVDYEQPGFTAIASSVRATKGHLLAVAGTLLLASLLGSVLSLIPLIGGLTSFCFQVLVVSRIFFALRQPRA